MHERILKFLPEKKNTKNTAIQNTKMNRRKLHCPRITKKKQKECENKKTSLKKPKKIQKPFSQALLICFGKKIYYLKVPVPVPAPAP